MEEKSLSDRTIAWFYVCVWFICGYRVRVHVHILISFINKGDVHTCCCEREF